MKFRLRRKQKIRQIFKKTRMVWCGRTGRATLYMDLAMHLLHPPFRPFRAVPLAFLLGSALLISFTALAAVTEKPVVRHISTPIKALGPAKWAEDGNGYQIEIEDPLLGRLTLSLRISEISKSAYTIKAEGTDYEVSYPLPPESQSKWVVSQKKRILGSPLNEVSGTAFIRFLIEAKYFRNALNELALLNLPTAKQQELDWAIQEASIQHRIAQSKAMINQGRFVEAGRLITDALGDLAEPLAEASAGTGKKYQRLKVLEEQAQDLKIQASYESQAKRTWEKIVFSISQAVKGAEGNDAQLILRLLPDLEGPLPGKKRLEIIKALHLEKRSRINYSDGLDALKYFSFFVRYGEILNKEDVQNFDDFFAAEKAIHEYLEAEDDAAEEKLKRALEATQRGFLDKTLEALIRFGRRIPPPPRPEAGQSKQGPFRMKDSADELEVGLEYLVMLPTEYHPSKQRPLLILCHGAKEVAQTELVRWYSELQSRGWIVAAPELVIGRSKGYLGTLEERQMITRTLADCSKRFAVDPNRVYIAGHSMGAFLTWDMALTYPGSFAAAAPFDGCPVGTAENYLLNTLHVPVYCVGSARNKKVAKMNQLARRELARLGRPQQLTYVEYHRRGHGFLEEIPNVVNWLEPKARPRLPKTIEFASADIETSRVHWLHMLRYKIRKPLTNHEQATSRLASGLRKSGTATLKGFLKGPNQVHITTQKVFSFRLYASREMFDFKKPLYVSINGKPGKALVFEHSRKRLLELTRQTQDRDRPYWCSFDIPVPK